MNPLQLEFSGLELAEPVHFKNLTLFPMLKPKPTFAAPGDLFLDDAMAQGLANITELNGGTVPELRFENRADQPILLLDGEELIGAKQNRTLNLTILAPAKQILIIPVSCVEAGRWSMTTPGFKTADHIMYAKARASRASQVTMSMRATGARRSDQGAVWEELAGKAIRMEASSPTQAMSAVYERHRLSLEEYLRAFRWSEGQVGMAFSVGGQMSGLDLFDHPASMRHYFPKLLRSYALDALDSQEATEQPSQGSLTKMLESLTAAQSFSQPSLGLGKDVRLSGPFVSGSALWAEHYVHICGFAANGNGDKESFRTRISRWWR